jgi:phosphoribosylformimino-5-aminoimidazole carboxamide ribotide isomerase
MRIIPAIDIIEGKCVRLTKGAYDTKKIYSENPLEMAKKFEASGIEFLHLVDLDGARSGRIVNYKVLETIAKNTSLQIDFGGGLKTNEDLKIAFESGATKITGGSIAVKNQLLFQRWISKYGSDKIILGADVREDKIAVSGWLETSDLNIFQFLSDYQNLGITDVICTDIAKDGMLEGPSFQLYEKIIKHCPGLNLIASGGVSDYSQLTVLKDLGCKGVIIGKAIYEDKITLKQLEKFIIGSKVC